MTIERERYNGPITFHCDGPRCAEVCETHASDFRGALAKAKSRGWIVYRVGEQWRHNCPEHANVQPGA